MLKPILLASDEVADTAELFLRSYQMYKMFSDMKISRKESLEEGYRDIDVYQELTIGQIAKKVLARMLSDGHAPDEEIAAMQTAEYSKKHFDIDHPLLKAVTEEDVPPHYYAEPMAITAIEMLAKPKLIE